MACFGAEVDFYQTINREFDKYFPGVTPAQKAKIEKQKKQLEKEAKATYEKIARDGGKGYGKGHKEVYESIPTPGCDDKSEAPGGMRSVLMIRVQPDRPSTDVTIQLNDIALRIYAFFDRAGTFPPSGNAEMVQALRTLDHNVFQRDEVNDAGRVIDPWGRPYVYKSPGDLYSDDFDLYSLGPCGEDQGGAGNNIMCELHRR